MSRDEDRWERHQQTKAALHAAGPAYPGVTVALVGGDGNVFTIIGKVAAALRRVDRDAAAQFTAAAWECHSYDEVLQLAMQTVNVE